MASTNELVGVTQDDFARLDNVWRPSSARKSLSWREAVAVAVLWANFLLFRRFSLKASSSSARSSFISRIFSFFTKISSRFARIFSFSARISCSNARRRSWWRSSSSDSVSVLVWRWLWDSELAVSWLLGTILEEFAICGRTFRGRNLHRWILPLHRWYLCHLIYR